MPLLIADSRKEETVTRLKKFYSTMQQVTYKAKADGNDWDYWAEDAEAGVASSPDKAKEFSEKYLLPYLVYHNYKSSGSHIFIYLNDGSYFSVKKGSCIDLYFDVNGSKKPNKSGRDVFTFVYCPKSVGSYYTPSKIIPYHDKNIDTREKALEVCRIDGYTCATLLLFDGWEFKDDYPYPI